MLPDIIQPSNYLMRMPDGTVKQMNPFTGTKVWTVPGRGHRPLGNHGNSGQKIDPAKHDAHCAFCAGRLRPRSNSPFLYTQLSRNLNVHRGRIRVAHA
jgi:galactose-1-phosphate uridylyltransferase